MKLLRLYVDGYKNLNNLEFDFSKSDRCVLIVGTNGTGKSNLLEVLSAIFSAVYKNQLKINPAFTFELEYIIERMRDGSFAGGPWRDFPIAVKISNKNAAQKIEILCKPNNSPDWLSIEKSQTYVLLPEHVVAIYSGEEMRLWEDYFFKSYDDYNKQYKDGKTSYKTQAMLYINKYYWDLIVGVLSIYEDDAVKQFLADAGLIVSKIECKFDITNMKNNNNPMAREMLAHLNPDQKEEVELSVEQISKLQEACGYEQDVFYNLLVLVLYKDFKIITEFKVVFENGKTIRVLSEGEKKLLLIYGATRIIEGECLFLLDEPDAHIHEGRKKDIFDLIKYMSYENQFVITSHSPTMTNLFDINDLFVLSNKDSNITLLSEDKKQAISMLTDGEWSLLNQALLFDDKKPLVIVEGKSDIDLIKQAIKEISAQPGNEKYTKIDYEFLAAGGTGNIPDFCEKIKEINVDKRIIVLCDNDKNGRNAVTTIDSSVLSEIERSGYKILNKTVMTILPKLDGITGDFAIEDYFSKNFLNSIVQEYLKKEQYKSFSSFPTVKKDLKEELGKNAKTYKYEDLKKMKILLDLLYKIGVDIGYIIE